MYPTMYSTDNDHFNCYQRLVLYANDKMNELIVNEELCEHLGLIKILWKVILPSCFCCSWEALKCPYLAHSLELYSFLGESLMPLDITLGTPKIGKNKELSFVQQRLHFYFYLQNEGWIRNDWNPSIVGFHPQVCHSPSLAVKSLIRCNFVNESVSFSNWNYNEMNFVLANKPF